MNKLVFVGAAGIVLGAFGWVGCSSDSATTSGGGDASVADTGGGHDGGAGDSSMSGDTSMNTDSSPTPDSSTGDGGTPFGDAGVMCGNTTCNVGQVCCATIADGGMSATETCMSSCPDGGVAIMCDGPAQCNQANPICCAQLTVGGTFPNCTFESGQSACASTCVANIPMQCPGMGQARLCHVKADCNGDSQNPNCCTFSQGGQTATICVNNIAANFGTCH